MESDKLDLTEEYMKNINKKNNIRQSLEELEDHGINSINVDELVVNEVNTPLSIESPSKQYSY